MRYCPDCGTPVERRVPAGDTMERAVCPACAVVHYVNPKVVVGSVCRWRSEAAGGEPARDQVLLCRRAIEPRAGFWAVPAGFLEIGESAREGALREAWEEAYARIEITGLLGVYDVVRLGQVQLFYHARLLSPEVAAGVETAELDLFDWDTIPWDELAFPSVGWVLRRALEVKDLAGPHPTVQGP